MAAAIINVSQAIGHMALSFPSALFWPQVLTFPDMDPPKNEDVLVVDDAGGVAVNSGCSVLPFCYGGTPFVPRVHVLATICCRPHSLPLDSILLGFYRPEKDQVIRMVRSVIRPRLGSQRFC
jgi:hypothetical protein